MFFSRRARTGCHEHHDLAQASSSAKNIGPAPQVTSAHLDILLLGDFMLETVLFDLDGTIYNYDIPDKIGIQAVMIYRIRSEYRRYMTMPARYSALRQRSFRLRSRLQMPRSSANSARATPRSTTAWSVSSVFWRTWESRCFRSP